MRRPCGARWSRSSPPRGSAKAPDLACPWCTAWPSNPADGSRCEAGKAKAPPPSFGCRSPKDRRRKSAGASGASAMPPADQRALVVVAVDDDALVLTNTIAMLDDLGHTGIAAASGQEALQILRQQGPVDLVITDYAMPQMTGLQLADAIKKEWPEIPVIIATGFAEMEPETPSQVCRSLRSRSPRPSLPRSLERITPRNAQRRARAEISTRSGFQNLAADAKRRAALDQTDTLGERDQPHQPAQQAATARPRPTPYP